MSSWLIFLNTVYISSIAYRYLTLKRASFLKTRWLSWTLWTVCKDFYTFKTQEVVVGVQFLTFKMSYVRLPD